MRHRLIIWTTLVAVLGSGLAAAGAAAPAKAKPGKPVTPACIAVTALTCGTDAAEAASLENRMSDHYREGQVVGSFYGTDAQLPGDVTGSGQFVDAGLWTGVYMAGESYRYALAKKQLVTQPTSSYWKLQLSQSGRRIQEMTLAFDRDVNIAQVWHTDLKIPPTVDPGGDPEHPVDFGGGVFEGQKGLLMRSCTPVDDPLGIKYVNSDGRVFGPFRWTDGKDYYCEGSPSRDTYDGITFGMLNAFQLVSPDFPAMRDMLRTDLIAMTSYLVEHEWFYIAPDGYVTNVVTNNSFDGFITPLFNYDPAAQLNMVLVAKVAADDGGTLAQKAFWDAEWTAEVAHLGPLVGVSYETDVAQPHSSYYKFNLDELNSFDLTTNTTGATRDLLMAGTGPLDQTLSDDVNAHFETLSYGMTGETYRRDEAITHLGQWITYRNNEAGGATIANSVNCGKTITCVPEDQTTVTLPGGQSETIPGTSTTLRSTTPLPVASRTPTDFLWQRDDTEPLDASQPANYSEPGIDYTTDYWMLRYFSEASAPAVTPYPLENGPSYS